MSSSTKIYPLSHREIVLFCEQIAMMLHAGISTYEGVALLANDAETSDAKLLYQTILSQLDKGVTFYQALKSCNAFPKYVLDTVRLGETSGKLEQVMLSLSYYYEREDSIMQSVRQAILYPFLMIAMMLAIVFVLITKILPIFSDIYHQLGSELNDFSLWLMHFGKALTRYSTLSVIVLFLFIAVVFLFLRFPFGNRKRRTSISLFFFSRTFRYAMAASRFASGMALALRSGLGVEEGLSLTLPLVDHPLMQKRITQCQTFLTQGESFSFAISKCNIFNHLYTRMITIGLQSGSADTVFEKIAKNYEEDSERCIEHFTSILEPTLVILLSVIVGMILLSVLLPLLGIMSGIT